MLGPDNDKRGCIENFRSPGQGALEARPFGDPEIGPEDDAHRIQPFDDPVLLESVSGPGCDFGKRRRIGDPVADPAQVFGNRTGDVEVIIVIDDDARLVAVDFLAIHYAVRGKNRSRTEIQGVEIR